MNYSSEGWHPVCSLSNMGESISLGLPPKNMEDPIPTKSHESRDLVDREIWKKLVCPFRHDIPLSPDHNQLSWRPVWSCGTIGLN